MMSDTRQSLSRRPHNDDKLMVQPLDALSSSTDKDGDTVGRKTRPGDGRGSWGSVTKGQWGIAAGGRHGCHQEGHPPPEARTNGSAGTSWPHAFGSPDGSKCYVESSQPVEAATEYTANLGPTQFYGTTTSTDACTTPVSFSADARLDRHRSHAKTTTDAATIPAFSFNPPATPTPFVPVPGIPVFIFGTTEAAPAPLDPLPRHAHQQHFRQSSIDELHEPDLLARTALLATRLARAFDPTAMSWQQR
jgi:hypothetical protein